MKKYIILDVLNHLIYVLLVIATSWGDGNAMLIHMSTFMFLTLKNYNAYKKDKLTTKESQKEYKLWLYGKIVIIYINAFTCMFQYGIRFVFGVVVMAVITIDLIVMVKLYNKQL